MVFGEQRLLSFWLFGFHQQSNMAPEEFDCQSALYVSALKAILFISPFKDCFVQHLCFIFSDTLDSRHS